MSVARRFRELVLERFTVGAFGLLGLPSLIHVQFLRFLVDANLRHNDKLKRSRDCGQSALVFPYLVALPFLLLVIIDRRYFRHFDLIDLPLHSDIPVTHHYDVDHSFIRIRG